MCLFLFLDTSRHYLPVNVIKQVIDAMSYAKLVRSVILKKFSLPFRLVLFFFLLLALFSIICSTFADIGNDIQ